MLWKEVRKRQRCPFFPQKKPGIMESHSQEGIGSKTGEVLVALCVLGAIAFFHQHGNEAHRIQCA